MEEKIKLQAVDYESTMTAPTRVQTLEADVKIEAKYVGDSSFTVISDTSMARGEVRSTGGEWEKVPAGKEMAERRVTITPKNIAWYKSRTAIKQLAVPAKGGEFMGTPGEKFVMEPIKKRTLAERKIQRDDATSRKLAFIQSSSKAAE